MKQAFKVVGFNLIIIGTLGLLVTEFPAPALNMARYSWVVSNEKLKRELNYQYRYTTAEAYKDFAEFAKKR
jgi:hypothetical protein